MSGIFISYRHNGGFDAAKHLAYRLSQDGYNVFFDKASMQSGRYGEQLRLNIDKCRDFIVILDPNVFDPTLKNGPQIKEDDWVAQEIAYALTKGKNIIPVKLTGFSEENLKDKLPKEILGIFDYHSPDYSETYYDEGFYNSLTNMIETPKKRAPKRASQLVWLLPFLVLGGIIGYYLGNKSSHSTMIPPRSGITPTYIKDTTPLLVIMGGGSVWNYINEKTKFDSLSWTGDNPRNYRYVYLPMASGKTWPQIGELRSVEKTDINHYPYHLVLLSATKANPDKMIPEKTQQINFRGDRGYVEEIKVGQNQLQIAVRKDIDIDKYLEQVDGKKMISIPELVRFMKEKKPVIYSTNKESGTYNRYDSLFKAHAFDMDTEAEWISFIDGQKGYDYADTTYIVLGADTYNAKHNDNVDKYYVMDENSKRILTNDLYVYFMVFKGFKDGDYSIPTVVRCFLKDIGIEMPEDKTNGLDARSSNGLILNIPPQKNELLH